MDRRKKQKGEYIVFPQSLEEAKGILCIILSWSRHDLKANFPSPFFPRTEELCERSRCGESNILRKYFFLFFCRELFFLSFYFLYFFYLFFLYLFISDSLYVPLFLFFFWCCYYFYQFSFFSPPFCLLFCVLSFEK